MHELVAYVESQNSTGFIVIEDGRTLVEESWPGPQDDRMFANLVHGHTADGVLLEDVASQQKGFIAVLAGIAVDKRLLDVEAPVSRYLGAGWSKAATEQEAQIRVVHILTMSSGLDERFAYVAPAGTAFLYNTPVYAIAKDILSAATGQPLEILTQDWLTKPLGMDETEWRKRPPALAGVGNATGLVTTPRDVAKFGQMILDGGRTADGARLISRTQLDALFTRSDANPAYGRLWWLNGGDVAIRADGARHEGPLIRAAPSDLAGAFGALDRRLYVVPSRGLVVVRTGAAAPDGDFDEQLWRRLNAALD